MGVKIAQTHLLLSSFFIGFLIAWIIPFRVEIFILITNIFLKSFLILAPFIVFVIIFTSMCSLQSDRARVGRLVWISVALYFSLIFSSAMLASIILSIPLLLHGSGVVENVIVRTYVQTLLMSSSNPLFLAIAIGFLIPLLLAKTKHFHKILRASQYLKLGQEIFFKALVKALPLICLSLGATLYYNLGQAALDAFIISTSLVLTMGALVLAIFLLAIRKLVPENLDRVYRYSREAFLAALITGSSYIFLPLHLEIFGRYFQIDERVKDLVLALGASLNRCGSVMGVLVVTLVSSLYTNYELSWQQVLLLAIPLALLSFGAPGIHGGTMLVTLSIVLQMLSPPNPDKFASTALALFIGTTFPQVAINSVTTGYVTLLTDHFIRRGCATRDRGAGLV